MVEILQKYFKKGITSILILSIFSTTLLPISTIYAQTEGSYSQSAGYNAYPTGGGITGGIGANISAITPLLSELPLCADKIGLSKVKGLFRNASSLLATKAGSDGIDSKIESEALNDAFVIEVKDVSLNNKVNTNNQNQNDIKKSVGELNENDTCLKSVGRLVTKMLLQKITVSTVEWINNGFEGKPLFLQDPGKFFGDIAKNEFLQFKLEIDDPNLYPFGRNFLRNQVLNLNRGFAENARYSLNELIQQTTPEYDAVSFGTNFSYGGWAAWDALTQVPANNPLGFNILASTELSARLEGTSFSKGQEVQKTLDQSGGFLGDERCVEPEGLTRAEHNAAIIKGEKEYEGNYTDNDRDGVPDYLDNSVNTDPNDNDGDGIPNSVDKTPNHEIKGNYTGYIIGTCKKWEYVTPGKLIAESATKVIGYPDNSILAADDLNTAIGSIMDALLNRWTADIANKGFANFDTEGSNGAYIYDDDNRTTGSYGQVDLDFPKSFTNSSWLRENPDFNIRTDLTQALIDEQRIYQQRLEDENRILNDLITTVRQLDYCIPGPHPGWEDDSERYLSEQLRKIPVKNIDDFKGWTEEQIGGAINDYLNFTSLGLFSSISDFINNLLGESEQDKLNRYYASILRGISGIPVNINSTRITGKYDLVNNLEIVFSRYIKMINKYYTRSFLPDITPQARVEFRKIPGYQKKIDNNEYAIYTLTGIINRLSRLKDQLDKLDPESTPYETYLPMINEFGRLSASMVTGNDIAKVIDDTKEEADQIKYVYDDLLTGPYGCEAELQTKEPENKAEETLLKTLRAEYPFDLWYDYNKLPPSTTSSPSKIPVPEALLKYNIREENPNIMPEYHPGPFNPVQNTQTFSSFFGLNFEINVIDDPNNNALGPGFLSAVAFNFEEKDETPFDCKSNGAGNILDCLLVSDLFLAVYKWPATVGRNQGPAINGEAEIQNKQKQHSFEQLIGIY